MAKRRMALADADAVASGSSSDDAFAAGSRAVRCKEGFQLTRAALDGVTHGHQASRRPTQRRLRRGGRGGRGGRRQHHEQAAALSRGAHRGGGRGRWARAQHRLE